MRFSWKMKVKFRNSELPTIIIFSLLGRVTVTPAWRFDIEKKKKKDEIFSSSNFVFNYANESTESLRLLVISSEVISCLSSFQFCRQIREFCITFSEVRKKLFEISPKVKNFHKSQQHEKLSAKVFLSNIIRLVKSCGD